MKMPKISACDVTDCAYNRDQQCHATAITVGDDTHPMCDTFFPASEKGGDETGIGHVGACKVSECKFNTKLECQAPGIRVGYKENEPDCLTFSQR